MISFHRRRESAQFLGPVPVRRLTGLGLFHATVRQGLYSFFARGSQSGRWRRALLPDYVPEGVFAPLRDAGLDIAFYPVRPDLSVDAAALKSAREAHGSDVLVHIHHFGIYREDSLRAAREALGPGGLLIEDFALSLPHAGIGIAGDIALFSFTKMAGVADGGLVWIRNRDLLGTPVPAAASDTSEDEPGRILVARMEANLAFEDWIQRRRPRPFLQSLARRVLVKHISYYPHLLRHYREIADPVSESSLRILEALDFEAILRRRREIAVLYLEGLDRRFHLGPPPEAYLRQALMAFPVRVADQERFHAHLARRGVVGFRLTDSWWFRENMGPSELYLGHYLLPASHYLGDPEIREVIACVNAYPG